MQSYLRSNSSGNTGNDHENVSLASSADDTGDETSTSMAMMTAPNGQHRSEQELTAEARKLRREQRKKERQLTVAAGTKATKQLAKSTIWIILVIGLVFCFCDVIYIMNRLERADTSPESKLSSRRTFSSSTLQIRHQPGMIPAGDEVKKMKQKKQENLPWIKPNHKPELHKSGAAATLTPSQTKAMVEAKSEVIRLIEAAGIAFDPYSDQDDAELLIELPYWENITTMYGDKPIIYGLDQGYCQQFQSQTDPSDHLIGVAGTFNSGTNLLAELLIGNCHMPERQKKYGYKNVGIRWQVPWGKHTPPGDPEYRRMHKTKKDADVDADNIMPMVTIRDPLIWLQSMCRHHYTAKWINLDPDHCPDFGDPSHSFVTSVKYADFSRRHDSIVHHFNDYYNEYIHEAKIPFLLVRFEDLVFHPEETTKTVCECAGGAMRPDRKFKYVVDSAKKGLAAHGKVRTGYVDALIKYSTVLKRYKGYDHAVDLEYIRHNLDPELMEAMKYPWPDPKKAGISKGIE